MSDPFVRSITFTIAATTTSPAIQITAVETATGTLQFTIDVLSTSKLTGDLRGLFFDFNRDPLLSELKVSGSNITAVDTIDVTNLGNGVTMQSAGAPYDVGVAFGTANLGKDDIKHQTFTLYDPLRALTLDDIADVEFGVRLTSVGSPTGSRTGSSKLVTMASAAPDARDDTFHIFEDGQAGLTHPATAATPIILEVLANDTDADHNTLLITAIDTPGHGTLSIVDGADADALPGDALQYTPTADYAGTDQFRYAISDGHGGTDFAWVHVNIDAVADVPTMSYTVEAGTLVNQVLIHVTAADHDVDGSEYIDRFEFSGLPPGVQLTALDLDPAGQPHQLSRDFLLTLPAGQSSDFGFAVTAIAKETANADEESNSLTVPIQMIATDNHFAPSFLATDRSLWGTNAGFDYANEQFFGVDQNVAGASDGLIGYRYAASIHAGLETSVAFSNGVLDGHLDYALDVQTQYNHTTDVLQISSGQTLMGGGFTTEGMGGSIAYDVVLNYLLGAAMTYNILDVAKGDILSVDLGQNLTLPLFSFDSGALSVPISINGSNGSLYVSWPDTASDGTASPPPAGEFSSNGDQPNFATLDIDIDALLGLPLHFNINIPDILQTDIDLADIDFVSDFDFFQSLVMQAQGLQASLLFENGSSTPFVFGNDLTIMNASAIDLAGNHDGKVDFMLVVDPQAALTNHTSLDLNLGIAFNAMTINGAYDVLDLASGTFHVGPLYSATAMADTPPLDVFNDQFALDFVGQQFQVSA